MDRRLSTKKNYQLLTTNSQLKSHELKNNIGHFLLKVVFTHKNHWKR